MDKGGTYWPLFLSKKAGAKYLGVSEPVFQRLVDVAGIDRVPFVDRYSRSDLDRLPDLLRNHDATQASTTLEALQSAIKK